MKSIIGASRRDFLKGASGMIFASGFGVHPLFGAGVALSPDVRFGVLSDVHLNKPGDEDTFEKALRYFCEKDVDGVILAGDIADTSRIEQLQRCADVWYKVFPNDKGRDGRHVEKLFVYGNHECWGWQWAHTKAADLATTLFGEGKEGEHWERIFHEKYEPIWMKNVKGFTFIGAHWTRKDTFDIEPFMEKHAKEIDPKKPFFYIQHAHPKDTCIGPWAWGRDHGESTRALAKFPNAVAFSGHSHYTLADERTIWQGEFTSINTSSLKYQSIDYSLRENINNNSHGFRTENRKHLMPQVFTRDSRQGMIVSVYGDTLVIERRDFAFGVSMGEDWTIQVPPKGDTSFAARAAKRSAPQFAATAALSFTRDDKAKTIEVAFPSAQPVNGCRVFEYEVTATLDEDEVELVKCQRRVMSPDFFLGPSMAGKPGSCVFSLAELQATGHYRFTVVPMDCYGVRGKPISANTVI